MQLARAALRGCNPFTAATFARDDHSDRRHTRRRLDAPKSRRLSRPRTPSCPTPSGVGIAGQPATCSEGAGVASRRCPTQRALPRSLGPVMGKDHRPSSFPRRRFRARRAAGADGASGTARERAPAARTRAASTGPTRTRERGAQRLLSLPARPRGERSRIAHDVWVAARRCGIRQRARQRPADAGRSDDPHDVLRAAHTAARHDARGPGNALASRVRRGVRASRETSMARCS
jgi:hypothetical protein